MPVLDPGMTAKNTYLRKEKIPYHPDKRQGATPSIF
jgi:hypothetical protein